MATVRSVVAASPLPRLEIYMLLQHSMGVSRSWLIAHDTDLLPLPGLNDYMSLAARRNAGEPMAYLIGQREFMGHDFAVTADVLIPRPETELLVETALDRVRHQAAPRLLDLGTGSGAIAVSIALARPDATVVATDLSPAALDVAAQNAHRLGAQVEFFAGDWYEGLPDSLKFDVIVSNPPYIAVNDPHLVQGDLRFEPVGALTDGSGGLGSLSVIVEAAATWLNPGGSLWMEHGWDQAQAVREQLLRAGFRNLDTLPDLAGLERVSGGYL